MHQLITTDGMLVLKISCVVNGHLDSNFMAVENVYSNQSEGIGINPAFKLVLPTISHLSMEAQFYLRLEELFHTTTDITRFKILVKLADLAEEIYTYYKNEFHKYESNLLGKIEMLRALGASLLRREILSSYLNEEVNRVIKNMHYFLYNLLALQAGE